MINDKQEETTKRMASRMQEMAAELIKKDTQLSEFSNQILEQNKEIGELKSEIEHVVTERNTAHHLLSEKDKEIEELRKTINDQQIRFKLDEPKHNRELEKRNIELEKEITSLKSQPDSKGEYGLPTDEEINTEFPERNSSGTYLDTNMGRREGAKWMRNKILSLSSKEESKAGFSLEDMKTMYNVSKSDTFENIIQSLTPLTSKVEAKPSQQEVEKKTAEEILAKKTGLSVGDEDCYIIHCKTEYVISAMEEYANQFRPTDSKEAVEFAMCPSCYCKHSNKDYEGYCCQSCFDGISR